MRTAPSFAISKQRGVTLVELLAFIVIISIGLVAILSTIGFQVAHSVDPVARVRALEKGQALLDEILARKFADNTPTGGVPACNPCDPIGTDIGAYDDVGDYHDPDDDTPTDGITVTVVNAGDDLGLVADQARLITVTVTMPGGDALNLSAYRVNF